MKNTNLFLLILLLASLFGCKKNKTAPPDITGKWKLSGMLKVQIENGTDTLFITYIDSTNMRHYRPSYRHEYDEGPYTLSINIQADGSSLCTEYSAYPLAQAGTAVSLGQWEYLDGATEQKGILFTYFNSRYITNNSGYGQAYVINNLSEHSLTLSCINGQLYPNNYGLVSATYTFSK